MKRRTFLVASLALLAGCAAPDQRPVYGSPWYESVRRDRYRKQNSPLADMDDATRHIDSMVRRVRRWNR